MFFSYPVILFRSLAGKFGYYPISCGLFLTQILGSNFLPDPKYNDKVRQNSAEGLKIGINGTPSFLLGISDGNKVKSSKLIIGAQPFFAFKQEIVALLKE
jgi:protein-disulfide isomerase